MKKIIAISIIMSVILALSIGEMILGKHVYGKIEEDASALSLMLEGKSENVKDDEETISKADDIIDYWNNYYSFLMMFSNHTTIKNFNDKVNSIKAYLLVDAAEDAYATSISVMITARDLKDENKPIAGNLL